MSVNPLPAQPLPPQPNLEQQRKRARELLNAARANDPDALRRFAEAHPRLAGRSAAAIAAARLSLHDAQLVIAREYGFVSWPKLKAHIDSLALRVTFEHYAERARRVLFFARYEAIELGSASIESVHVLLGLFRDGDGVPSRMFARSHLSRDHVRKQIEDRTVIGEKIPGSVEIPFSLETKRVLTCAAEEAGRLSHEEIETAHLLLGILRVERSTAASILMEKGMRLKTARDEIVQLLNESERESES